MLKVKKTIKMFVGGAFIRSESGRVQEINDVQVCHASKKDVRNAVAKALPAAQSWWKLTPYLRSQMIYRAAEVVHSRDEKQNSAVNALVHYAGWCDKYQQAFGSVNPVSTPHHNFSTLEPMGVVFLVSSAKKNMAQLFSDMGAILAAGNSVIVLLQGNQKLWANDLGEIFQASDFPAAVVNFLTGDIQELLSTVATHREIAAIAYQDPADQTFLELKKQSVDNLKRVIAVDKKKELDLVLQFCECKTVWHPIGL